MAAIELRQVSKVYGAGAAPAEVSAKLGRGNRAPIGSRRRLHLDAAEIRFFDPETTNALPRLS